MNKNINIGDYVYVFYPRENYPIYKSKTLYKVVYVEDSEIIVEVSPTLNKIDSEIIKGWNCKKACYPDPDFKELKEGKLYWWVKEWKQRTITLNNE